MYYDVITVKFDWLRGHDYVTIPVYVCWSLWPRISDEGHEVETLCYSCYFASALDYSPRTGSLEKQTSCCQVPSPLLCYWEVEGRYYIAIVAIHAEVWINFAGTCARPNMQVITGKDSSLHLHCARDFPRDSPTCYSTGIPVACNPPFSVSQSLQLSGLHYPALLTKEPHSYPQTQWCTLIYSAIHASLEQVHTAIICHKQSLYVCLHRSLPSRYMLQLRLLVCVSLAVCTWRYKHTTLHAPMVWTAQCVQPCCVVCAYWLWLEQFSTSDEVGHDVIWHKKCLMSQQLVFRRGCMGWQKLLSQQKSSEKCSRSLDVTLEWYIKTWGNPATPSVPKSYSVRYVTVWNFSLNWAKYTILYYSTPYRTLHMIWMLHL